MSISLTSALTVPHVSQAYAANVHSARTQDPRFGIYPAYTGQDNHGRPAHPDTYVTVTAGVSNPLARINVENKTGGRAAYHQYLNTQAIEGDYDNLVPSFGKYDTLVGKAPGRDQGFRLNGQYTVPFASSSAGQVAREANYIEQTNRAMRRKYESQRFNFNN